MMKFFLTGIALLYTGLLMVSAAATTTVRDDEPVEPAVIEIIAEPENPRLGESFDLIFRTANAAGIYYIEAEVGISPLAYELTGLQPGNLFGNDALFIGDYTAANRVGFSATSTGDELSGIGELFILNFQVSESAAAITYNLAIINFRAIDKEGNVLETQVPGAVQLTVRSFVSWAGLQTPGSASIEFGFTVEAEARVIVPDVTSVNGPDPDIGSWIGISTVSEEPWLWPENAWLEAGYKQRTTGAHVFTRTIGSDLQAGTYYVASRIRYQDDDYVFGGYDQDGGGFWDGINYVSGILVVNEPGLMVVAEWNFNDDSMIASRGIFANIRKKFSLIGANHTGFVTGSPGRAATSNGWNGNNPEEEKYWLASLSTTELQDLKLSFKMKSSGTGPRDFMLQAGTDTLSWNDLLEEPLQLTDNFNQTNIVDLGLPESLDNQETIYLRWLLVSDRRVNESEDPITGTGSSQIDEVRITGRPLQAQFPAVWPGDTNNDGVVDETDVLPIGFYWRSSGPARAVTGPVWQESPAVGWIPLNATFSDTDGSGMVNQSDLLAVGLNFGNVRGVTTPDMHQNGIASEIVTDSFTFPAIERGKMLEIDLVSEEKMNILGVSYSYSIDSGVDPSFEVRSAHPGEWAGISYNIDSMLRFQRSDDSRISGAVVHKGSVETAMSDHLITLRIAASGNWERPVTLSDFKLNYINPDGNINRVNQIMTNYRVVSATGLSDGHDHGVPAEYRLKQNYPNPFNPATLIQFEIPESGDVRIDVYSITGQHVATLTDEYRQAGYHSVLFNAVQLASGVYIYRMQAGQILLSGKMTLLK